MKLLGSLTIALCLLLMAIPSLAHHSFAAEFDANNCKEFTGTLTKLAVVLEPQKLSEEEQRRLHEELAKALEAVQ